MSGGPPTNPFGQPPMAPGAANPNMGMATVPPGYPPPGAPPPGYPPQGYPPQQPAYPPPQYPPPQYPIPPYPATESTNTKVHEFSTKQLITGILSFLVIGIFGGFSLAIYLLSYIVIIWEAVFGSL